jgi:hypothetical protein
MSSNIPITAAYRKQIEERIADAIAEIDQKWIFIFKERRDQKMKQIQLKRIEEELKILKDNKESKFREEFSLSLNKHRRTLTHPPTHIHIHITMFN